VHEVDALGGEMGKAADATYLQKRVLNSSKGPAVWALRAQTDKIEYSKYVKKVLEATPNLHIREGKYFRSSISSFLPFSFVGSFGRLHFF
jgi:tRNA uridine 5-carboxymethylaminomethyl modification enzyme